MEGKPHLRFTFTCSRAARHLLLLMLILLSPGGRKQLTGLSDPTPIANLDPACDSPADTQALPSRSNLRGQQAEWELGRQLAAATERSSVMLADDFILQYLNRLEQKILRRSDLPGCFVVKILVDAEPNAFSLPGGFIYVTTGLIDISDAEGELAAALAHETAHVIAHHTTEYLNKTRIWGRLALWGGPAGYLLQRYVGPLVMFNLIREEEFEADRLGVQYEVAAGYDSLEFRSLLQRAIPESGDGGSLLDRLYDTHPTTAARVRQLMSASRRAVSPPLDRAVSTSEFQDAKAQLARLMSVHHS